MSTEIEISIDSVQRALKKYLEGRFVRRTKRKSSDGRRISDGYQLLLGRDINNIQSGSCDPADCGSAKGDSHAAAKVGRKPQNEPSPDRTVRSKSLEEHIQESSGRIISSTPGGDRLEKRLGKVVFDAWFANVVFLEERDQVLYFQSGKRHAAAYIEQQFDQSILDCFHPEYELAVRVRVLVPADGQPHGPTQAMGPSHEVSLAGNSDRGGSPVRHDFHSLKTKIESLNSEPKEIGAFEKTSRNSVGGGGPQAGHEGSEAER